ncbi:MAG: macrocin-O-methyltransferase [Leptospiraceae bacterium]|nr:macrocin-O-methyltransferase [Leptospiraceae bacterium]
MNEVEVFEASQCGTDKKLANFPKYVRRQTLARFLVQHELFKLQLETKGSIVECGVHHGGGVMAWAKLSATLEPYNYHRTIVGFDSFSGFPGVSDVDSKNHPDVKVGMFGEEYDVLGELTESLQAFDENRFIGHIPKVDLVKGDAIVTIPEYMKKNPHFLVSLLYLDFDIYEPTKVALEHFLPRMPRGAILAFDELNNPDWPGETLAMLESKGLALGELRCFPFEPNISYLRIGS